MVVQSGDLIMGAPQMKGFRLDIGLNWICNLPRHRMKFYRECLVGWLEQVQRQNNNDIDKFSRYLVPLMWNQAILITMSKLNRNGERDELALFAQSLEVGDLFPQENKDKFVELVQQFGKVKCEVGERIEQFQMICEMPEFYGDMHHETRWDEFISIVPQLVMAVQDQGLTQKLEFWWETGVETGQLDEYPAVPNFNGAGVSVINNTVRIEVEDDNRACCSGAH